MICKLSVLYNLWLHYSNHYTGEPTGPSQSSHCSLSVKTMVNFCDSFLSLYKMFVLIKSAIKCFCLLKVILKTICLYCTFSSVFLEFSFILQPKNYITLHQRQLAKWWYMWFSFKQIQTKHGSWKTVSPLLQTAGRIRPTSRVFSSVILCGYNI